MRVLEIICVHEPHDLEVWKDDQTIEMTGCLRCHVRWRRGDAPPRVVIAELEDKHELA